MKTYRELYTLVQIINAIIEKQETKTQKKLAKIGEKLKPHLDEYQNKIEDIRLDNAAVTDKGVLILNKEGGYEFTKEGYKKCTKEINDFYNSEFEFKPIEVINPSGLDELLFLKDWVNGVDFKESNEEPQEEEL